MFLRICRSLQKQNANRKQMGPQTPNPQIATFAKDTKFKLICKSESLRISICGTYLRTAHLWWSTLYIVPVRPDYCRSAREWFHWIGLG